MKPTRIPYSATLSAEESLIKQKVIWYNPMWLLPIMLSIGLDWLLNQRVKLIAISPSQVLLHNCSGNGVAETPKTCCIMTGWRFILKNMAKPNLTVWVIVALRFYVCCLISFRICIHIC